MEAEKFTDNQQYLPISCDAQKAPNENCARLQAQVKVIPFFCVREKMPYIESPKNHLQRHARDYFNT